MRRIIRRIIWTRRALIFFVLVIIFFIFINLKIDKLRENIRYDLEKALTETTGEKVKVGVISGGLIRGLLCEGISIKGETESGNRVLLETGNIHSNLSLSNVIFHPSKLSKVKLKIDSPHLYTNHGSFNLIRSLANLLSNNFPCISDKDIDPVRNFKHVSLGSRYLTWLAQRVGLSNVVEIEFNNAKITSDIFTPLEESIFQDKDKTKENRLLGSDFKHIPNLLMGFTLADNLEGNILITSENISFNSTATLLSNIEININGNVGRSGVNRYSQIDFNFNSRNINGQINIFGIIDSFLIRGYITLLDNGVFPVKPDRKYLINGDINFAKNLVKVKIEPSFKLSKNVYDKLWTYPENREIEIIADFSAWPIFKSQFYMHHILLGNLDLCTNIFFKIYPRFDKSTNIQKGLYINLSTSGTVVNFMPFEELTTNFSFLDRRIEIEKLEIGENITGEGSIYLEDPIKLDLSFSLNTFLLDEFKNIFLPSFTEGELSGIMNADVKVKGNFNRPEFLISIEGSDGRFGNIHYDKIILEIEGIGSKFKILDGVVYSGETRFKIKGDINVSKIGSEEAFNIEFENQNKNSFIFEKWQISAREGKRLDLIRDLRGNFRLRFTAIGMDEAVSGPMDYSEFEIKYKLTEDKSFKIQLRKEEEVVGIKKSFEF